MRRVQASVSARISSVLRKPSRMLPEVGGGRSRSEIAAAVMGVPRSNRLRSRKPRVPAIASRARQKCALPGRKILGQREGYDLVISLVDLGIKPPEFPASTRID